MWFFSWILKFFSAGVVKDVTSWLTARSNDAATMNGQNTTAATSIIVAQMQAEVAARQAQASVASQHGWVVGFIIWTFAFHVFTVMLDSVFHFGWKVFALPAPMDTWEGLVILAVCGAAPITNVANRLIDRVWK